MISVSADEIRAGLKGGGGTFEGTVRATWGDIHLECNWLEVLLRAGSREPESMTARGAIRMQFAERTARADRLTYDATRKVLVLEGKVEMVEAAQRVTGARLEFRLEDESIACSRCSLVFNPPPPK